MLLPILFTSFILVGTRVYSWYLIFCLKENDGNTVSVKKFVDLVIKSNSTPYVDKLFVFDKTEEVKNQLLKKKINVIALMILLLLIVLVLLFWSAIN